MNITRILKSRWFGGAVCLILAIAIMMVYTQLVQSQHKTTQVAVLTADVKKGDLISKDHVATITVGALNLSDNFVKDADEVAGKYALADMQKEDYIQSAKLADRLQNSEEKLLNLDGLRQAISVKVDFAGSVSDKIVSGDIVSCIVVGDEGAFIPPELTYVELLAATTINGVDKENAGDQLEDNLSTATLLVTPEQAVALAQYNAAAYIHLALVYRGAEDVRQQFLDQQAAVLDELSALDAPEEDLPASSDISSLPSAEGQEQQTNKKEDATDEQADRDNGKQQG